MVQSDPLQVNGDVIDQYFNTTVDGTPQPLAVFRINVVGRFENPGIHSLNKIEQVYFNLRLGLS